MTTERSSDIDVSIVICTCNRAAMLRDALASLVAQQTGGHFAFEIVVVCQGDAEQAQAVIDDVAAASLVPIRAVHDGRRGHVVARNLAVESARGTWLAHFDDDQIADTTWLKELMATAARRAVRVVGGAMQLKLPADCQRQLAWHCRRTLGASATWNTERPYTRREGPGSGNLLIHRSVFEEIGTYDVAFQLRGEDTDFYRRLRKAGIEAWFTPRALAFHVTPAARLEDRYFRETCLHNGWTLARRDLLEWGRFKTLAVLPARLGKAALLQVPRMTVARLCRARESLLAARCGLWQTEGYVRGALYGLSPSVFQQRRLFARHEFRADQQRQAA